MVPRLNRAAAPLAGHDWFSPHMRPLDLPPSPPARHAPAAEKFAVRGGKQLPQRLPSQLPSQLPGQLNAEGSAGAVDTPVVPLRHASLATLLAGHVLQDGELVLLILKPSVWFLVLSSLPFAAVASILLLGVLISTNPTKAQTIGYVEAAVVLAASRFFWAILQWMGRFYILTDLRILRLGGVFNIELFDCPLRKVARTRGIATTLERITRTGSVEIVPVEGGYGNWQTIDQPAAVHDQIVAAINRAKQGNSFPG
jgi:hypothetical protein